MAADNYKLDRVTIEYNDGDDWVLIGSKDLDVHSEVVTFTWDTTGLTTVHIICGLKLRINQEMKVITIK